MKIRLNRSNNWTLCYILDNTDSKGIECVVSVETGKRWNRICNQFEKVQDEMETIYDKESRMIKKGVGL